jgi:hypothetical protein
MKKRFGSNGDRLNPVKIDLSTLGRGGAFDVYIKKLSGIIKRRTDTA